MIFKFVFKLFVNSTPGLGLVVLVTFFLFLRELLINLFEGYNEELVVVLEESYLANLKVSQFLPGENL
jgi:hypothetical protein